MWIILEIGHDGKGIATVEGDSAHEFPVVGNGRTKLKWQGEEEVAAEWKVTFTGDSPFQNGKKEFSSGGPSGGPLRKLGPKDPATSYKYDVWCRAVDGSEHETDPRVILEPN